MQSFVISGVAAILFSAFVSTTASAQTSCSGFIESCVAKAVALGTPDKEYRPKCIREANNCKKTGCFVGPTSRATFACNLEKR